MRKLSWVTLTLGFLCISFSALRGDAPFSNGDCNVLVYCGDTFTQHCVFAGYGNFYNCSGGPVTDCSTTATLGTCYGFKNGVPCQLSNWPACGLVP